MIGPDRGGGGGGFWSGRDFGAPLWAVVELVELRIWFWSGRKVRLCRML